MNDASTRPMNSPALIRFDSRAMARKGLMRLSQLAPAALSALAVVFMTVGCRTFHEVRFIDPDGNPVEGVLTLSASYGMLHLPYCSATVSDSDGRARMADGYRWLVIKRGFHTIDSGRHTSYELHDGFDVEPNCSVILRPVAADGASFYTVTEIEVAQQRTGQDAATTDLLGGRVTAVTEFGSRCFRLEANDGWSLLPSRRFWFDGAETEEPVPSIAGEHTIAAYLVKSDGILACKLCVIVEVAGRRGVLDGEEASIDCSPIKVFKWPLVSGRSTVEPERNSPSWLTPNEGLTVEPSIERALKALDDECTEPEMLKIGERWRQAILRLNEGR